MDTKLSEKDYPLMGHLVFVIHKFSFCIENLRTISRFSMLLVMYIEMDFTIVLIVKSHAKYNATLFCAMPKHIKNR